MRLEKKRNQELAKRKGLTGRTIAMVFFFILSFVVAYFITEYLFAEGYVTPTVFYTDLFIPESVPVTGLKIMTMFAIVVGMQIIFSLGFMLASPAGRRRTGDASLYSRNKDPFDDQRY